MSGSAGGGSYTDPYATPKANLRDAIKWLAGIFAALAAVVVAGTPISNLSASSLSVAQQVTGVIALLTCFGCICTAVVYLLRLLRSDAIYLADIDSRVLLAGREHSKEIKAIRDDLKEHKAHFYPDYDSLEAFFNEADEAMKNAQLLGNDVEATVKEGRPQTEVTEVETAYARQLTEIAKSDDRKQNMLAYASYMRFYGRVQSAAQPLLILGVVALAALLVFTLVVQPPKDEKAPTVVVVPLGVTQPASSPMVSTHAGTVHFAMGSPTISAPGRAIVEQARNGLLTRPDAALLVIARTDTVGSPQINERLARERAAAVRSLLIQQGGIASSRVFVAEVPKSDLPTVTEDQEPRDENRSVSLYFVPFRR